MRLTHEDRLRVICEEHGWTLSVVPDRVVLMRLKPRCKRKCEALIEVRFSACSSYQPACRALIDRAVRAWLTRAPRVRKPSAVS